MERWWGSEKERALGFREREGEKVVLVGFVEKGREVVVVVVVVKSVAMDEFDDDLSLCSFLSSLLCSAKKKIMQVSQ